MRQLGITTLRPGPSGQVDAPNPEDPGAVGRELHGAAFGPAVDDVPDEVRRPAEDGLRAKRPVSTVPQLERVRCQPFGFAQLS
jgi:hypothetical protein